MQLKLIFSFFLTFYGATRSFTIGGVCTQHCEAELPLEHPLWVTGIGCRLGQKVLDLERSLLPHCLVTSKSWDVMESIQVHMWGFDPNLPISSPAFFPEQYVCEQNNTCVKKNLFPGIVTSCYCSNISFCYYFSPKQLSWVKV